MTYAHRNDIFDADTHMMERADWLYEFADKSIKDKLEPIAEGRRDVLNLIENAIENYKKRKVSSKEMDQAKSEFMIYCCSFIFKYLPFFIDIDFEIIFEIKSDSLKLSSARSF